MKEIVFTVWDEDADGVMIREYDKGKLVATWQENSWGYFDQWLRCYAPINEPVILRIVQ